MLCAPIAMLPPPNIFDLREFRRERGARAAF